MATRANSKLLPIDLIVLLAGLVAVLIAGYQLPPLLRDVLRASGTGLIAAAFVSLLSRYFSQDERAQELEVRTDRRSGLEFDYRNLKLSARNLDICGISLTGALEDFSTNDKLADKLLSRVLFEGANVRLIFLDPASTYVAQRAREDGVALTDLQATLRESVKSSVAAFRRLSALRSEALKDNRLKGDREGNLEIRIFDGCPYCTIYRTDDVILWGIYTCHVPGIESAVIRVAKGPGILARQLGSHFETLWASHRENSLVRYQARREPFLNQVLVDRLLPDSSS